jgi:hypothetical protein
MLDSGVLDVAIGLSFVYLFLSLICTVVNEWLARVFELRAQTLEKGIRQLLERGLERPDLEQKLYAHPLVKALAPPGRRPSYLPSRTFALALLDLLKTEKGELEEGGSKAFAALKPPAGGSAKTLQQNLENWFDDSMDRVSGWYKREVETITLVVAALIVLAANADTLDMASRLWANPTLREAIVEQAKVRAQQPPPLNVEYADAESPLPSAPAVTPTDTSAAKLGLSEEEREAVGQVMGWSADLGAYEEHLAEAVRAARPGQEAPGFDLWWWAGRLLFHLPGWFVTVLALSLGAPFWFDTLNRFINLRSAGKAPPKSNGSASNGGAVTPGQAAPQGKAQ